MIQLSTAHAWKVSHKVLTYMYINVDS